MVSPQTKKLGSQGEAAVVEWLQKNRFTIVCTNFTSQCGEIDIIATKGDLFVFVEVKTRHNKHFPLSHLITQTKQERIARTAQVFIQKNKITDKVCRFDVACVIKQNNTYLVEYIENAFQAR